MMKRKTTFMGIAVASLLVVASFSVFAKTNQEPDAATDPISEITKIATDRMSSVEIPDEEDRQSNNKEVYTIPEYEKNDNEIIDEDGKIWISMSGGNVDLSDVEIAFKFKVPKKSDFQTFFGALPCI